MKTLDIEKVESNSVESFLIEPHLGISKDQSSKIKVELEKVLANSYGLMNLSQMVHWNVRGLHFLHVHEFTEHQYNELFEAVDEIAERIRALGFLVPGNTSWISNKSEVTEISEEASMQEMMKCLLDGHRVLIKQSKKLQKVANDCNDEATVDLAVRRILFHEKTAWMLRSLLSK